MPFRPRYEHFEFPKLLDLPVFKEPPEGAEEGFSMGFKSLRSRHPKPFRSWHFCHHCAGWIEGEPHENRVNTLDGSRLSGRRGTEFFCRRCAKEIGFSGLMS